MGPGSIRDLVIENAESGRWFALLSDLAGKVEIKDHDKFVRGWREKRDYAIFEYVTIAPATREAASGYFSHEKSQDLRDFKRLEEYGLKFVFGMHYQYMTNTAAIGDLGT